MLEVLTCGITLHLGLRKIEGAVRGGVRPKHPCGLHGGAPEWGRSRKKDLERPSDQLPEIVPGRRKDSPRADLGKVVRSLLSPDNETVPHAPEIPKDRFQPLGVLKKGPHTFQDHETGSQHPTQLDEVENDLASRVPVAMTLPHPAKSLAREPRRNEVGPTCCAHWDLSSMGWHLAGLVRAWAWATLYAWVASRLMSQARVVEAPRDWAATYCEPSYSACHVSMCPWPFRVPGVARPPDKARWGHADLNYGRAKPRVA